LHSPFTRLSGLPSLSNASGAAERAWFAREAQSIPAATVRLLSVISASLLWPARAMVGLGPGPGAVRLCAPAVNGFPRALRAPTPGAVAPGPLTALSQLPPPDLVRDRPDAARVLVLS